MQIRLCVIGIQAKSQPRAISLVFVPRDIGRVAHGFRLTMRRPLPEHAATLALKGQSDAACLPFRPFFAPLACYSILGVCITGLSAWRPDKGAERGPSQGFAHHGSSAGEPQFHGVCSVIVGCLQCVVRTHISLTNQGRNHESGLTQRLPSVICYGSEKDHFRQMVPR